jgi:hypothetical protein
MTLLYGRAGRLTAKNGGFRPGQSTRIVVTDDSTDWWTGHAEADPEKRAGTFPKSFVASASSVAPAVPVKKIDIESLPGGLVVAVAKRDYEGEEAGDMSFHKGDVIVVTEEIAGGWWCGYRPQLPDVVGQFPSSFVKKQKRKKSTTRLIGK